MYTYRMPDLYDYTDYRQWIKDAVDDLKGQKPIYSWRYIAGKLQLDAGNLLRIAQGKVHLSPRKIRDVANFFSLNERDAAYFEEMVFFGRAKTDKEALDHFERMQEIKGVDLKTLEGRELEFYRSWTHNAIRSLLSIIPTRDEYELIGRMCVPAVKAKDVEASVQLMQELGMLQRDAQTGVWEVTAQFVSSGKKWQLSAVREFQRQTMDLAKQALEEHHPDLRDISTVTMTLNRTDIPAIRERIRSFRSELLRFSQEGTGDDSVMQLNVQLFPLALVSRRYS